ncbi:MAG TPA: LytR C-terminal domain-containing protein [Nocardioides sp.]|uniref:LytR C-terminal domain-containing protein n=1 Tax=Nocardioides sp. TaxID=35761 RepID=UPI002C79B146|nr:LytR C-terminal domain-containing protein [Nocardioides sp.]HQR26992.1 LytR C-terminal domain-containing protein [Nocardioides sp.]
MPSAPQASTRRRDERGVAFPSPLVLLSILAVTMAGLAFVVTGHEPAQEREIAVVARPSAEPSPAAPPSSRPTEPTRPAVRREKVYVEVYNNSGITGLAGRVATRAANAGWRVVGSDNWYGTIPASTVYYPPRLAEAGKLLALDLGIGRRQPAVDPMQMDRLTVILTDDAG